MKVSNKEANRSFYEYAIWRAIDQHNNKAIAENQKNAIIHTSQGRKLRKDLDQFLRNNNLSLESLNFQTFTYAMNNIYGASFGGPVFDDGAAEELQADRNTFVNMTGLNSITTQKDQNGFVIDERNAFWPISPYDPRYANLGSVLDNGSKLGAVNANYNFDAANLASPALAIRLPFYKNLELTDDGFHATPSDDHLYNLDDISGLSRLRLWMTSDEYNNIRDYVNDAIDRGNVGKNLATYQQMANKAVYILQGLKREGYTYKISKDNTLGRVKATVDGTKLSFRVMDTPANADYIGTTYDAGVHGSYSASRAMNKNGSRRISVTPQQALDLVNFALGNTVYIRNAQGQQTKVPVGRDIINSRYIMRRKMQYHMAYHNTGNFSVVSGPLVMNGKQDPFGNVVRMFFNSRSAHGNTTKMYNDEAATKYLEDSIATARTNFSDRINVDGLIDDVKKLQSDPNFVPTFDNDPLIENIQQNIWDSLTSPIEDGERNVLLKPGVSRADFDKVINGINDGTIDESELDKVQYDPSMTPEAMARSFVKDNIDYNIGQLEPNAEGKRFNPANVVKYQTSQYGLYRGNDDMIKALRLTDIQADELLGNDENLDNIANQLVKFDLDSARKMKDVKTPFMQSMYSAIKDSLANNGVTFNDDNILIDKNGIVQYKGSIPDHEKLLAMNGTRYPNKKIDGQIGQIFEPKQDGLDAGTVYTKFAGNNNYAFIPGYEAKILPQKAGENKSVEERTILTGYKQKMLQNIKYQIRQDLMRLPESETVVDDSVGLNNTYRQVYCERKDPDFIKQYQEQGMPDAELKAIVESISDKVRYSNDIRDHSTVNADYQAQTYGYDYANDNNLDPYNVTGNRNMSLLTKDSDGYFDPIASNATTTNQGIAKFLASGAKVSDDGHIIQGPTEGPGSRMPLMNLDIAKFMNYDTFDRQNMTISNWLQATSVKPKVHVAQMTMNGWNQDDGVVISKNFAQNTMVRDNDGNLCPAKIGDKILDCNGNKGVINLIVDPDMDPEKAKQEKLTDVVNFFKANPKLDVAMAPFSAVSRYNGGTARQLMRNPEDLTDPKTGKTIKAAMGTMPMIVTDKAADVKTKIYTDDDIKAGKGRKVSAQLSWILAAKDANNILHQAFGHNDNALSNLTEYMNVLGMDVDPLGNFRDNISPEKLKNRTLIKQPELIYNASGKLKRKATEDSDNFADKLNKQGGMMELPFDIKLKNGKSTKIVPVMSSYLRSGQELVDDTIVIHDYTHQYENMYSDGILYRDAQNTIAKYDGKTGLSKSQQGALDRAKKAAEDLPKKAQNAYNSIANDVIKRKFEGKHNIFRDNVMAHRMPKSATSIWTADPRLDIDTIGMSPKMAKQLGLKNGDSTLIWRDPSLRDGAIRYMKIQLNDKLTGVSINPSMDKSFDGDFDGDTVGIVALDNRNTPQARAARREAKDKFGVKNNLLDYGSKNEDGNYDLYMQHSLDIMVAEHNHPELNKEWKKITKDVNDFEKKYAKGEINKAQVDMARTNAVGAINKYYQKCYQDNIGTNIRYDNVADHLKSIKEACLDTGAKGSMSKFAAYSVWLGAKMHVDEKGNVDWDTVKDVGHTLSTRDMQIETMKATAIKSFGTGVAGAFSQRGIKALRNLEPKAILELTYPVTQSILQVKHDPKEAVQKYDMMMGPVRNIWRGYSMSKDNNGKWSVNRDEKGKPLMATKDEWVKTFEQIYTGEDGLNVNINDKYVKEVADALSSDNQMISVENAPSISLMDKLAYNGTFDDVVNAAKHHDNLFKGKYNAAFASNKLRDNVYEAKKQLMQHKQNEADLAKGKATTFVPKHEMHQFGKSDVNAGESRKAKQNSRVVRETITASDDDTFASNGLMDSQPVNDKANQASQPTKASQDTELHEIVTPSVDGQDKETPNLPQVGA